MKIDKQLLLDLIDKIKPSKVLIVGDLILDEFLEGEVARLSREAPIPIIHKNNHRLIPGGAGNAANNIVSMGGQAFSIGTLGNDLSGTNLKNTMIELGVNLDNIVIDNDNPTTTKTRITAYSKQSVTQQVARIDTLPSPPLKTEIEEEIINKIENASENIDTILISDYKNGVVTEKVIAKCFELAHKLNKNLVVDSQGNLGKFKGATILTPNQPEAEDVIGYEIKDSISLEKAGKDLLELTEAKGVLITRGSEGMSLFESNGDITHIPAFNKREVFDVTGAGDTVVATLSLGLASGLDMKSSMVLANLAASLVVRKFGTSTTNTQEMKNILLNEVK